MINKPSSVAKNVLAFYLLDGFSLQAVSSALSALLLANETSGEAMYGWRIVSPEGGEITSSCGLKVLSDLSLHEERQFIRSRNRPYMAVVSGGREISAATSSVKAWLRECVNNRVPIATLAGGTFIPARTGLFQRRRWAVHWEQYPAFSEEFPDANTTQSLYEIDGDLMSCAGGNAAFDMFLKIVEKDLEPSCLSKLCEKAMVDRVRVPGERQRLPLQTGLGIVHPNLLKVIDQMVANLVRPLRLEQLAQVSGLSRRQLERLFRQYLGRSPGRYYLELRLERAALLIERSALPIVEVAMACGFASSSHFTKSFKMYHGKTPQHTRLSAAAAQRGAPSD